MTDALRLFTSESVTEGHPDKICDQISDTILDALLTEDVNARVAVETLVTTGLVHVAGEVTTEQRSGHVRTDVPPRDLATLLVAIAVGAGLALETGLRFDLQGASSALLALLAASKAS